MKAAMFYGREDIRIEEVDEPQLRPGSVKIDLAPFVTSRILADDIVERGIKRLITHKDEEVKILVSMR